MPNYVLMTVGLTKDGFTQLTSACRTFLWGKNAEGSEKKALIAWEKICNRKEMGGLGLDQIGRSIQEVLILGKRLRLSDTPTLARVLEGWWEVRHFLELKADSLISGDLKLEQALKLLASQYSLTDKDLQQLPSLCSKAGITYVQDLTAKKLTELEALDLQNGQRRQHGIYQGPSSKVAWAISHHLVNRTARQGRLEDATLWQWTKDGKTVQGWKHANVEWRWLLQSLPNLEEGLNRAWSTSWPLPRWKNFWEKLWNSQLFLRDKIWIWKTIHGGHFVHEKLIRMQLGDGKCPRGCDTVETINHSLLECVKPKQRWNRLRQLMAHVLPVRDSRADLLEEIEAAANHPDLSLPLLALHVCHSRAAWRERCSATFQRSNQSRPLVAIIQEALDQIKEVLTLCSARKRVEVERARSFLLSLSVMERQSHPANQTLTFRHFGNLTSESSSTSTHTTSNTQGGHHNQSSEHDGSESSDTTSGRLGITSGSELMALQFLEVELNRLGFTSV
ncbi:hypothetical protein R1sor_009350 [Riccia sorocarpa]|uniref:Reverse transcriptase zinc-binding domain-containing protein n=1 Tax=Riccia sorocarpa TaxID=122646 RepID=A0ABD3HWW3_9MARC